jgi:hypothetical protein
MNPTVSNLGKLIKKVFPDAVCKEGRQPLANLMGEPKDVEGVD